MTKLFDLYYHNNIVVRNQPMALCCGMRNKIIQQNYPDSRLKGCKKYYTFFKIKFNNSCYKPVSKK